MSEDIQHSLSSLIPVHTGAEVWIADKKFTQIVSLEITQQLSEHNKLVLKVYPDAVQSANSMLFDGAENLLGKYAEVIIYNKNDPGSMKRLENKFYVTDVQFVQQALNDGMLVITGHSPTWALDGAPGHESFCGETLSDIVETLCKPLKELRSEALVDPSYDQQLNYACRFNENTWNYLRRLANETGQFLYFDGNKLIFGEPQDKHGPALIYGQNCYQLNMSMHMNAIQNSVVDYDPQDHDSFSFDATEQTDFEGSYRAHVFKQAEKFGRLTQSHLQPGILPPNDMLAKSMARSKGNSISSGMYTIKGESTLFQLQVGMVTELLLTRAKEKVPHTSILITSIVHYLDAAGNYRNAFRAISAACKAAPPVIISRPVTHPILATVISNNDPKGQGRVKVCFEGWFQQHSNQETDWIHVLTPNAGSSDAVSQNRGLVFIPEKGDQVLIDFEAGNPDRPFVAGSMFHGRNGAGGKAKNHLKTIITRSGHKIEFDDEADGTHIIIKDPGGNEIHMDTKGKNITITAPETMTLNCKNMKINVDENMDVEVGQNETKSIGQNKTLEIGDTNKISSLNKEEDISQNLKLYVGDSIEQTSGDMKIVTQSGDMILKGAGKTLVQGRIDARISKG